MNEQKNAIAKGLEIAIKKTKGDLVEEVKDLEIELSEKKAIIKVFENRERVFNEKLSIAKQALKKIRDKDISGGAPDFIGDNEICTMYYGEYGNIAFEALEQIGEKDDWSRRRWNYKTVRRKWQS